MPHRWGIWLAVEGDVRFLSHHDMARAIERAAIRAALPLRYTQGFNPHPRMSLACPRPVGVASRDDLLVVWLEETDDPVNPARLGEKLNNHTPRGVRVLRARLLPGKKAPRPVRVRYETPIAPERCNGLRRQMDGLAARESWPVERIKVSRRRGRSDRKRVIDLQPLVAGLTLEGDRLTMTLVGREDLWARPGEVLGLLGLDARADLAGLCRTAVDYQPLAPEHPTDFT